MYLPSLWAAVVQMVQNFLDYASGDLVKMVFTFTVGCSGSDGSKCF